MTSVLPDGRGSDRAPVVQVWYDAGVAGQCFRHANEACRSAEHGIAVDRFAHEIVGILTLLLARARQLNARPLGRTLPHPRDVILFSTP